MLFSYNWLKEFVDGLDEVHSLSDRLTITGTEIETVTDLSGGISGVVTAEVATIEPHPNADKLSLCDVNTADGTLKIVCGAKNMKPGDKVVLAVHGARLPGDFKIKRSKIRGVESNGMMCSEVELGIAKESDGIMILPSDTPIGLDALDVLGLQDFILDAGITPNRPDLLSMRGLAREVAAVTDATFTYTAGTVEETGPSVDGLVQVSIEEGAPCTRYSARVIEGVAVGPTPDYIVRRLETNGLRSVNNIVDITNYVLLELGQPLHAFDLDKIGGAKIVVRNARGGETIETIDNVERTLPESVCVIADESTPVAVAGIMGGKASEVSDSTTRVLLESAYFIPTSVRRASKALGLSSDSSYRFERGVDIDAVTEALDRAAALILEIAGGTVAKGRVDLYPEKYVAEPLLFRVPRAEALLGIPIDPDEMASVLKRLGMGVAKKKEFEATGIEVTPPSYRRDILIEEDLLEEAARLFGYDNIPTTLPVAGLVPGGVSPLLGIKRQITEVLSGAGMAEALNYSFVSKDEFNVTGTEGAPALEIMNPLSAEQSVMRRSLMPSLLETLRRNLQVKNEEAAFFEVAPVFTLKATDAGEEGDSTDSLPTQRWKVAGVLYGPRWSMAWNYPKEWVDFYDIKGIVERVLEGVGVRSPMRLSSVGEADARLFHPGKSAAITLGSALAGSLGEIHPEIQSRYDLPKPAYIFELDIEAMAAVSSSKKKYRPLARYPGSVRDVAFIVKSEVPYSDILTSIEKIDTKLIEKVDLFDVYCGSEIPEGSRSIALRVKYRSIDGTLKQAEVDAVHSKVQSELSTRFGAEIRGDGS
ncbi:MAG: phenylalanine--tRNA ligase subunit beta [Proteobacteria bacterium]|nr:phenylalanine--tRNA ligase subunit beta [Pseudomonadota bacterium]